MAKLTQAQRLTRQGVAFVEVDGILARLTKKQSADPGKYARAVDAVALAVPLAARVRERVRDDRRPATGALPGYGRALVYLSEQYAQQAGLAKMAWRSSDTMHAALGHAKMYHVTGGMWAGMQVRGSGPSSAVIDFGGSSIGRGTTTVSRQRGGRVVLVAKPVVVRNSQKAGGILFHHKIHVLEPTVDEIEACSGVLMERLAYGWQVTAGSAASPPRISAGDPRLSDSIRAHLTRKGT
jgi:hypothetical protein